MEVAVHQWEVMHSGAHARQCGPVLCATSLSHVSTTSADRVPRVFRPTPLRTAAYAH